MIFSLPLAPQLTEPSIQVDSAVLKRRGNWRVLQTACLFYFLYFASDSCCQETCDVAGKEPLTSESLLQLNWSLSNCCHRRSNVAAIESKQNKRVCI